MRKKIQYLKATPAHQGIRHNPTSRVSARRSCRHDSAQPDKATGHRREGGERFPRQRTGAAGPALRAPFRAPPGVWGGGLEACVEGGRCVWGGGVGEGWGLARSGQMAVMFGEF